MKCAKIQPGLCDFATKENVAKKTQGEMFARRFFLHACRKCAKCTNKIRANRKFKLCAKCANKFHANCQKIANQLIAKGLQKSST